MMILGYLKVLSCSRSLLFRYMDTSLFSLVFPLEIIMILDFCSLNVILFSFAQLDIFLISNLAWFSASRTVSALTAISKSSGRAIAFVRLPHSRLSSELYWIFQNAGPQQEPWDSLCSILSLCAVRAQNCCPSAKVTFSQVIYLFWTIKFF